MAMGDVRIISTRPASDAFGFFAYADTITSGVVPKPLRRICSLMRNLNCSVLVEEELAVDATWQAEVDLASRIAGRTVTRTPYRISFYRTDQPTAFSTNRDEAIRTTDADVPAFADLQRENGGLKCLGFLYLLKDEGAPGIVRPYVHAAVVDHGAVRSPHRFVHSECRFSQTILGVDFSVTGSYFSQQQGYLSCCAHATAITALTNLYTALGLQVPFGHAEINELFSVDHRSRLAYKGLGLDEIAAVFEQANLNVTAITSQTAHPDAVIASAYHAVECGLPVVVAFNGTQGHVMTAVGHCFDEAMWPGAREGAYFNNQAYPYLPSHTWVDALIVQDDNFGPYCTLPRDTLLQRNPAVLFPIFPWASAIRPEFAEFFVTHLFRSQIAWLSGKRMTYFQHLLESGVLGNPPQPGQWFEELLQHIAHSSYVLRSVPITPQKYVEFLSRERILEGVPQLLSPIQARLGTDPFWLVEISVPELYQHNTRRLGEVAVRVDADFTNPSEPLLPKSEPLLARVPGAMSFFVNNDIIHVPLAADYHYPIELRTEKLLQELFVAKVGQSPTAQ